MSDVALVVSALARVRYAARAPSPLDPRASPRLTDKQLRILEQLDEVDPVMVTELAEYLGVTPSTMSLNLGRLETGGLVRRARDPVDRRVMNVFLTAEGVRTREGAALLEPARMATLLDVLRPEERRRVVEGLTLLAEAADTVTVRARAYVASLSGGGPEHDEPDGGPR